MGPNPTIATMQDDTDAGMIPRAFMAIFQSLAEKKAVQSEAGADLDYQVSVQFLELYGEEIRDLLTANRSEKLTIRDLGTDEPEVVGATQTRVSTATEALQCLAHGILRRVTGATAMNESSSRSHAVLSVCIEQSIVFKTGSSASSDDGSNNEEHMQVLRSKFNFVDLAGAERQKRTGASGKRFQEGIDINKGLSNLGNVISALGDPKKRGRTHVPYRDAKLTRLLKGSLGGNHKTLMIACVSPAAANMGESLNCLRYANRAKNIQNKAVVNVDANTRLVQELQGQVTALASDLLKALDGDTAGAQFTRETLVSLVNGAAVSVRLSPSKPSRFVQDVDHRLKETESELFKTQDMLRQVQSHHDAAELELHTARAQNTVCDAQITALTQNRNSGPLVLDAVGKAFTEKALAYEQEIGTLRGALREAESKMNRMLWNNDGPMYLDVDHLEGKLLEREVKEIGEHRDRLMSIRAALSLEDENETTYHTAFDFEFSTSATLNSEQLEAEEKGEHAEIDALTNKYLKQVDPEDDEGDDIELKVDSSRAIAEASQTTDRRGKQFAADLEELSQSIEMKERLINQIKRNKEREAVRNFLLGDPYIAASSRSV
jgi:Kinesin motor domain